MNPFIQFPDCERRPHPKLLEHLVCADGSIWSVFSKDGPYTLEGYAKMATTPDKDGYLQVSIYGKKYDVHRLVLERPDEIAGGVHRHVAVEHPAPAVAPQPRDERERRSATRGFGRLREQVSLAADERLVPGLGQNPHRPAADETRIPSEVLGEPVLAERPAAARKHLTQGQDGVGLDAATAQGAERPRIAGREHQLRAHHLRRAAVGADDGREGERLPGGRQLGHALVGGRHENAGGIRQPQD